MAVQPSWRFDVSDHARIAIAEQFAHLVVRQALVILELSNLLRFRGWWSCGLVGHGQRSLVRVGCDRFLAIAAQIEIRQDRLRLKGHPIVVDANVSDFELFNEVGHVVG